MSTAFLEELHEKIKNNCYNYVFGKILLVREYRNGVENFLVAEGNHRAIVLRRLDTHSIKAIIIAAPNGILFNLGVLFLIKLL